MADMLDRDDRAAEADKVLAEALKAHPDSILLHSQQYRLGRRRQDWDAAMAALVRLSELQPRKRTYYLRRLVETAIRADQFDQALAWVRKWKQAAPGSHLPHLREAGILG